MYNLVVWCFSLESLEFLKFSLFFLVLKWGARTVFGTCTIYLHLIANFTDIHFGNMSLTTNRSRVSHVAQNIIFNVFLFVQFGLLDWILSKKLHSKCIRRWRNEQTKDKLLLLFIVSEERWCGAIVSLWWAHFECMCGICIVHTLQSTHETDRNGVSAIYSVDNNTRAMQIYPSILESHYETLLILFRIVWAVDTDAYTQRTNFQEITSCRW